MNKRVRGQLEICKQRIVSRLRPRRKHRRRRRGPGFAATNIHYEISDRTRAIKGSIHRLAALIPPPRKHRHRYHGVFAPNHPLRQAATALAIGNIGKQRDAKTGEHAGFLATAGSGCCGSAGSVDGKSCHHDTSRIAWAKLLARVGEAFPLTCPTLWW